MLTASPFATCMGHDSLTFQSVRKYVGRAGGTVKVAAKLGVSVNDVIRWSREGLLDEDQAIRLMDLGEFRACRYGSPPRCTILLPGEIEQVVERFGGFGPTAKWLKISIRTLRRYRAGDSTPPEKVADQIRTLLAQKAIPQRDGERM